jgi:hypothetical protein
MGGTFYNHESRTVRASSLGYATKSASEIFTQQKERKIHESMNPKGVRIRECRDSEAHPNATPIMFWLDVTGSMGHIPHQLIKEGLPKLMGNLIQKGIPDAALCFGAVGDHEVDNYPLQIGQFESGDEELDMWLTRTYLEGGGGGNEGESYLLAYYFAAYHTEMDSLIKRGKKGFLFTVGDEPCLKSLSMSAVREIMGDTAVGQTTYSVEELLAAAQQKFHVYHINLIHGHRDASADWMQRLGQNCINVTEYTTIPDMIAKTILKELGREEHVSQPYTEQPSTGTDTTGDSPLEIYL